MSAQDWRLAGTGSVLALLLGCTAPPVAVPVVALEASLNEEQGLPLQPGMASRLHKQVIPAEAKGTLVMYHGFSGGPWQFDELAEQAKAAGFNVYVPRLPGHGLRHADGSEDSSQLPVQRTLSRYEAFAERTFQEARALGAPVSTLGLSVGGGLALRVAEAHAEVKQVVAYAPFFRPKVGASLFDGVQLFDRVPVGAGGSGVFTGMGMLGLGGEALGLVPFGWGKECEQDRDAGRRSGHCGFTLGNIYGNYALGAKAFEASAQIRCPVQFFVTGADDAAEEAPIRTAYLRSGGAERNGWYYYPASEGIPHPMLSPKEDKGRGHTPALHAMTLQFLTTGAVLNRGDAPR